MTDSNATERLRKLLDERGVEYVTDDGVCVRATKWRGSSGIEAMFVEYANGECRFAMDEYIFTPEQAVDATLGAGKCKLVETDSYSNAHEVIHQLECSACGGTCEHVNGSYGFCPHCGAKVKR